MTAPHIVDPAGLLGEALAEASPDLMRSLLQTVINALLSADADAVVGAEWGQPTPGRRAQRNGYRHRGLDTRVGTIDVAVPKLRKGTYFPDWLLERSTSITRPTLMSTAANCSNVTDSTIRHYLHRHDFGPRDRLLAVGGQCGTARIRHVTVHRLLGGPLEQLDLQRPALNAVGPGSVNDLPIMLINQCQDRIFVGDQCLLHPRVRPEKHIERQRHL
ncbi:transposase [Mycobacterium avium 11-0986]|nr:transposase [Mycobacterium avium 11-0986]